MMDNGELYNFTVSSSHLASHLQKNAIKLLSIELIPYRKCNRGI